MPNPQQPDLARAPERAGAGPGLVPEANRPGHHPEHEQDKPTRRPPVPSGARRTGRTTAKAKARKDTTTATKAAVDTKAAADTKAAGDTEATGASGATRRFAFAFERAQLLAGIPFGVTPLTTGVTVDHERLHIRYGPWSLTTPLANVAGTTETGPYQLIKIAGPPHLSLSDRGVSFCTRRTDGLCIEFHEPVRAIAPFGLVRHPAATVTVEDRDGLRRLLESAA